MIVPVSFFGAKVAEALPGDLENTVLDHGDVLAPGAEGILFTEVKDPVFEGRVGQKIDLVIGGLGSREGKGSGNGECDSQEGQAGVHGQKF